MAVTISGVIPQVGTASGFTTASYTLSASTVTIPGGKMATVSAKGGTQPASIDVHSASRPFTFMVARPAQIRSLPPVNNAGVLPYVPVNVYSTGIRKGCTVTAGQPASQLGADTKWRVPAGVDQNDPNQVAALVVAYIAWLTANQQGIIDLLMTGEP